MNEVVIREVTDTLMEAKLALLGIVKTDTLQTFTKKCKENETSLTRQIDRAIDIIQQII